MPLAASHNDDRLSVFPVFLKVENRFAVVVGDGPEAVAKARLLRESRIAIRLVSREPNDELAALIIQADLEHVAAHFSPDLIAGAALVFAATGDEATDSAIVAAARTLNIPVNAVDRPCLCDFYTPALVNRAPIAVAIGSEGTGPVLTQMIRSRIETLLPRSTGPLARLGALYRVAVDRLVPRGVARRRFWRAFFDGEIAGLVEREDLPGARRAATRLLKNVAPETGFVWLVAAGSGEADLLTLRAVRAMQEADVVLHGEDLSAEIVAMGRRDAQRIAFHPDLPLAALTAALAAHAGEARRAVVIAAGQHDGFDTLAASLAAANIRFAIVPAAALHGSGVTQSILAA
jgi:uroporphyrin-III C-methyltransferase / precorrin-2 dehydrogenase / sirohydrochlorin ferrochelatase